MTWISIDKAWVVVSSGPGGTRNAFQWVLPPLCMRQTPRPRPGVLWPTASVWHRPRDPFASSPQFTAFRLRLPGIFKQRQTVPLPGSHLKDKTPSLCLSENDNTSDTIRLVDRRRSDDAQVLVHGNLADSSFHSLGLRLPGVAEPSSSSELPTTPSSPPLPSMAAYNCMCLSSPEALAPTQRGPSGDVDRRLVC